MTASASRAALERYRALVSPEVGIIRSLQPASRGVDEPNPPVIYQAMLSHFDFRNARPLDRAAVGKGATEDDAALGAIGEAVERYCASHPDAAAFQRGTRAGWAAMGRSTLSPAECVLYADSQYERPGFPYRRWDERLEIAWLPARELPGGAEVLVPAGCVYLNYSGDRAEELLCPPTSNGLAAGPDLESAILHGLLELVERDGFLITWMNRLPVPEVDFARQRGIAASIAARYRRFGVETRVFNLTTDLPGYVMMALALDRTGRGPAATIGLGCHLDPAVAVLKALFELCQVHAGEARRYRQNPPQARLRSYADVRTLEDHSAFFTMPERLGELAWLLEAGRRQRLEDLPGQMRGSVSDQLATVVSGLARAGSRALYVELTTPDVRDFGVRVVRAIATGLQPMHFGHGEERLGGRRLYEVPRLLGYAQAPTTERDLNPCPHPLA